MISLTPKQRELYNFISDRIRANGVAPSYEEMAQAIGGRSRTRGRNLVLQLEDRGYIRRVPHRARAIEIIHQIEGDTVKLQPEVREAALEYARRTHTSLPVVIAEAVAAYVGKGGE